MSSGKAVEEIKLEAAVRSSMTQVIPKDKPIAKDFNLHVSRKMFEADKEILILDDELITLNPSPDRRIRFLQFNL